MAEASAGFLDLLRICGALVLVVGLVLLTSRLARRGLLTRNAKTMQVEERLPLARGVQAVVLKVEGQRLLVGVSEHGVQLVTELNSGAERIAVVEPAAAQTPPAPSFSERLAALLRKGAA